MSFRVLPLRVGGPIRRHGSHILFGFSVITAHRIKRVVKSYTTLYLTLNKFVRNFHKINASFVGI